MKNLIQRISDNKYLSNNEWVTDISQASELTIEETQQAKQTHGTYKVRIVDIPENAIDIETKNYLKRIEDGKKAVAKLSAELRVAKLNGLISEQQHKGIDSLLVLIRTSVLAGQWIEAKDLLADLGSAQIGQSLYDKLNNELTTYISDNY